MSRFVLATAQIDFQQRVRDAFGGSMNGDLRPLRYERLPTDPAEVLAHVPDADAVEVVLIGPGVSTDEALVLAGQFDRQRPDVSVVIITKPLPKVCRAAMRAGVRDVLAPDATDADVKLVLERASQAAADRRRALAPKPDTGLPGTGRIITIASPKGGSGKTTVATNVAVALAGVAPQATVLVDLDLQFGDVGSALALVPDHCVTDAVHGPASQDAMVLKTFLTTHPTGLHALCAPPSPADADHVTADQISHLLALLSAEFRYVVVDTSPGLSECTLAALDAATDAVLIAGMDVPSVRGLRKELDVFVELGLAASSRHVVVNFADPRSGLTVPDIETTIGMGVDVTVPRSRAVPPSTNHGSPLLHSAPRDPAAKALQALANRFVPTGASKSGKRLGRKKAAA
jgi:Flp pilus assembly CpaE family ATPase